MVRILPLLATLVLSAAGAGAPLCAQAEPRGASSGREVLRDFLLSHPTLKQKVSVGLIVELSPVRAEVYAEEEGYGHAVVAFRSAVSSSSTLEKLCHAALTRKYFRPLVQDLAQRGAGEREVTEAVNHHAARLKLRGVEVIGQRTQGEWKLHGCRVRLEDVTPFDYDGDPAPALATANYAIAKQALGEGDHALAIASLKKTTTVAEVYRNAVAFIVPLVAATNADMAAQIESRYLAMDEITDGDALHYYGRHLIAGGRFTEAQQAFSRCLQVDGQRTDCRKDLEMAVRSLEGRERQDAIDFDKLQ